MKSLSPLQVIFFIISCFFVLFAIDGIKRKKLNVLHFFVFFGGSGLLILFTFNAQLLNIVGQYIGVAKGSDLIVYSSIIILFYFFLNTNNKLIKIGITNSKITRIISLNGAIGKIDLKYNTVAIMPAYKQTKKVINLIQELMNHHIGVIFIDDGFNENLSSLLKKRFINSNVVIISHPFNMGQGAALQTGQQYIIENLPHTEYILHFDSDGQHQVKDIIGFQKAFINNPGLDIVLGSRFLKGSGNIPLYRKCNKKIQLLFTRVFIGIKLTDTHNGFRMMRYSILSKLEITLNDYTHASEIESLIKTHQLCYREVPVDILYNKEHIEGGQSLWNAFRVAKNVIYQILFFR